MANQETVVTNYYETSLSAEMGPTALTATVASMVNAPTSPSYLAIQPESATYREVILFDGTYTGSAFVSTAIGNRYLSGSAASSGITHPVGSRVVSVPLRQHIEDLNDRIDAANTSITNKTHASLTSVTADQHHTQVHAIGGADHSGTLAHSALSSVTADQHHAQVHAIGGADHTGTLAHSALATVTADQHHAQSHGNTDHTTTGTPGSSALGDAAAQGSSASVARLDHVHGREAFGTPGSSAAADTVSAGAATTVARSDHRHGREARQVTILAKTSDQASSSTSFADVTSMTFAVAASQTIAFRFELVYQSALTSTGIGLAVNGPASPTRLSYSTVIYTAGTNAQTINVSETYDAGTNAAPGTANANFIATVSGLLVNGSNAGTFALRVKSAVGGSAVTIKAGSVGLVYT